MTVQLDDILKLDEILKPCVELTSLSLSLSFASLSDAKQCDALGQKLANDVSLLIGHHPTLKRLVLDNFKDVLVGYRDKYHLPTSLETLVLYHTTLMRVVDLEHGTDASTTSHIRDLTISNFFYTVCPSDIEGYLKFVESQAETLVSLHINLSRCVHEPTVDRLKHMAKRLEKSNKLQRFTYHKENVHDLLEILLDVLPLIESLKSYNLSSDSCLYDRDFIQSLQLAMKKICIGRKGLLDFAKVIFCGGGREFHSIPIVEYEELSEVLGCECHLLDGSDGEYIAIREYEDLCDVLGYQRQLLDVYDCEQDMDYLPISEYEEVCEVLGYQRHVPDD